MSCIKREYSLVTDINGVALHCQWQCAKNLTTLYVQLRVKGERVITQ